MDVKEGVSLKGVYIFTKAILEKPEHFALDALITARREAGQEFLSLVRKLNAMCRTEKYVYENIVPTVGRTMIANMLGNSSPTNIPYLKYTEVGTGVATPANADIALGTPFYRNLIASRTNAANVAYATAFYNATEVSGTFTEAGIFSDGTITLSTGVLISHVTISVTKSTSNTLTIDWSLTFT